MSLQMAVGLVAVFGFFLVVCLRSIKVSPSSPPSRPEYSVKQGNGFIEVDFDWYCIECYQPIVMKFPWREGRQAEVTCAKCNTMQEIYPEHKIIWKRE